MDNGNNVNPGVKKDEEKILEQGVGPENCCDCCGDDGCGDNSCDKKDEKIENKKEVRNPNFNKILNLPRIKEISRDKQDKGYYITLDNCCGFFFSDENNKDNFVPKINDFVEIFEYNGARIRGISFYNLPEDITDNNSVKLFGYFKSDEQLEEESEQAKINAEKEKQEKFELNKEQMDKDYESLPPVFKARIDRFRLGNPKFRIDFEGYEVAALKQAIKIAEKLKTIKAINAFKALPLEEKRKLVELDDSLSGNQFYFALHMAKTWILYPRNIIMEHGAMATLVGDEQYEGKEFREKIKTEFETMYIEYKNAYPDFIVKRMKTKRLVIFIAIAIYIAGILFLLS